MAEESFNVEDYRPIVRLVREAAGAGRLLGILANVVLVLGLVSALVLAVAGIAGGAPQTLLVAVVIVATTLLQFGLLQVGCVVAKYVAFRADGKID